MATRGSFSLLALLAASAGWLIFRSRRFEKRVEKRTHELDDSRRFLESLIQNIPNMIFVKDARDLRFVRMNRAGEELLGMPESDLLGKSDYDFFPNSEAEAFTTRDREVLNRGRVVDIPEEPLTTSGGIRYLHTKKIPLFDRQGRAQFLLGISEDITERKVAEQARLRLIQEQMARAEAEKTTQQLKFLAEAGTTLGRSLDLGTMLDTFARFLTRTMADACWIQLKEDGDQEERLVRARRDEAKIENDAQPFPDAVWKVIESGRSQVLSSGKDSIIISPIRSGGKTSGTLTLLQDHGAAPYTEPDVNLADELARRASFAIENARLYDRAQEASRAKSAFLANVSHEIRTPLGAMLGFADLIADEGSLNDDQRNSVLTILRNGRQLLRIVDEILDLSKIESDYIQIERIPFSLQQVLEEVSSLMRMRAEERSLHFEVVLAPDLPRTVVSDPMRLRQILINILGNAVKFTEKGHVRIEIRMLPAKDDSDHRMLEFSITDTGIGIGPDQAPRLFQPFVQADSSMSRRFGGTGLGLFLSRRLARLLGGDVVLSESEIGRGSRFTVTVEVRVAEEGRASAALENRQVVPFSKSERQRRILIVDDSPDNRLLVMHYLKNMGFQIESAENGRQAIEMALREPYDLILMDIQMPGVDGFQAVRELRERGYRGLIVALTAHAMKGDRERCLAGGFDDYLQKPLDKEILRENLTRHLQEPAPSSGVLKAPPKLLEAKI